MSVSKEDRPRWQSEMVAALSPEHSKSIDVQKAQQAKDPHLPDKLYRYRPVNKFSLSNLRDDTQWMSNAAEYNDPFDTLISVDADRLARHVYSADAATISALAFRGGVPDSDKLQDFQSSKYPLFEAARHAMTLEGRDPKDIERTISVLDTVFRERMFAPFDELGTMLQRELCACSFSTTNDSLLMWSHYANRHSGICIEYDIGSLDAGHQKRLMLFPVLYGDRRFDATAFLLPVTTPHHAMLGVLACLHKAREWAYEREWRFVTPGFPEEPKGFNTWMPKPTRVLLGARISQEARGSVVGICIDKGIEMGSMKLCRHTYRLIDEPWSLEGGELT